MGLPSLLQWSVLFPPAGPPFSNPLPMWQATLFSSLTDHHHYQEDHLDQQALGFLVGQATWGHGQLLFLHVPLGFPRNGAATQLLQDSLP